MELVPSTCIVLPLASSTPLVKIVPVEGLSSKVTVAGGHSYAAAEIDDGEDAVTVTEPLELSVQYATSASASEALVVAVIGVHPEGREAEKLLPPEAIPNMTKLFAAGTV